MRTKEEIMGMKKEDILKECQLLKDKNTDAPLAAINISCVNCIDCTNCTEYYSCKGCLDCSSCFFCKDCLECNDCMYCISITRCTDCFGCCNIYGEIYMICNVQFTEEEYAEKMKELCR